MSHTVKSRNSLQLLLWTYALTTFIPLNAIHDVESIRFKTYTDSSSESSGTITVTLWFNFTIYEYSVREPEEDTTYTAYRQSSPTFTVLGLTECPPSSNQDSEAKVMIQIDSSNGVYIKYVRFDTISGDYYKIRRICVPSSDVPPGWSSSWEVYDSVCPSGHDHYETFCIDTQWDDCEPSKQMLAFDLSLPNQDTQDALWSDATSVSPVIKTCNPTPSPTYNPTTNTKHPTLIPTQTPTRHPSQNPTPTPTRHPTLIPTPNPTESPSQNPSDTPSKYDSQTTATVKQQNASGNESDNALGVFIAIFSICFGCCGCVGIALLCYICVLKKHNQIIAPLFGVEVPPQSPGAAVTAQSSVAGGLGTLFQRAISEPQPTAQDTCGGEAADDELTNWLAITVALPQYLNNFVQNGYDNLIMVQVIREKEQLKEIGIDILGHQMYLLSEIDKLRQMGKEDENQPGPGAGEYEGNVFGTGTTGQDEAQAEGVDVAEQSDDLSDEAIGDTIR